MELPFYLNFPDVRVQGVDKPGMQEPLWNVQSMLMTKCPKDLARQIVKLFPNIAITKSSHLLLPLIHLHHLAL